MFDLDSDKKILFADPGTRSDGQGDTNDKEDKITLLAKLRKAETDLYQMKKIVGYKGAPAVEMTEKPKEVAHTPPITPVSTSAPSISAPKTVPFNPMPDSTPFVPTQTPPVPNLTKIQTDAFNTPLKPIVAHEQAAIPKTGVFDAGFNSPHVTLPDIPTGEPRTADGRSKVGMSLFDMAQENVPKILKQREITTKALADLESAAASIGKQKLTPEQQAQFTTSYSEQKNKLLGDLSGTEKYNPDIAYYHFSNKVKSIGETAYGTDKDGNVVIPNQTANKNQLTSAFWTTLKEIVAHEKKNGHLKEDVTDQDILNGVMGSQSIWHDIMGDQYAEFRTKYHSFFEQYKQAKSDIDVLDGQYKAKGGREEDVPVSKVGENTGVQGAAMKGVVVPKEEVTWDSARRINQDLTQGASNVTFDALGKAGAFMSGIFGDSYQHQDQIKGTIERGGSRLGRALSGVMSIIPDHIKSQLEITDNADAVHSDWSNIVGLFSVGGTFRSPTAGELHSAMKSTAQTPEQQKLVENTDSAKRDVIQAVAELGFGMEFGDFAAAGKLASVPGALMKEASAVNKLMKMGGEVEGGKVTGTIAAYLKNRNLVNQTIYNAEDATVTANKLKDILDKEKMFGKSYDEIVAGTTEGQKAIRMAKMMLPPNATLSEAAHLAGTMAIQSVAHHADNMTVDDIKQSIVDGTIFGIMNVGFGKLFGGVAQRMAVAKGMAKGAEAGVIADMIPAYSRVANVLGQMATMPAQSKIGEAVLSGNWNEVLDPSSYMNRKALIDIAMGGFGIKDMYRSLGRTAEERKAYDDKYNEALHNVANGTAHPDEFVSGLKDIHEEVTKEESSAQPVSPVDYSKMTPKEARAAWANEVKTTAKAGIGKDREPDNWDPDPYGYGGDEVYDSSLAVPSNKLNLPSSVDYQLAINEHLDSPKLKQRFKQFWGTEEFWSKLQTDLHIPKTETDFLRTAIPPDITSFEELVGTLQQVQRVDVNYQMKHADFDGNIPIFKEDYDPLNPDAKRTFYTYEERLALAKEMGVNSPPLSTRYIDLTAPTANKNTYHTLSFATPGIKNRMSIGGIDRSYHDTDFNSSPDYVDGRGTQVAWARVAEYKDNNDILQLQELQSPFQKMEGNMARRSEPLPEEVVTNRYGESFALRGDDFSEPTEPEYQGKHAYLRHMKDNWERFMFEGVLQNAAKQGYSKLWVPTAETIGTIEHFPDEMVNRYNGDDAAIREPDPIAFEEAKKKWELALNTADYIEISTVAPLEGGGFIIKRPEVIDIWNYNEKIGTDPYIDELYDKVYDSEEDAYNVKSGLHSQFRHQQATLNHEMELNHPDGGQDRGYKLAKGTMDFYEKTLGSIINKSFPGTPIVADSNGDTWREIVIPEGFADRKITMGKPYKAPKVVGITEAGTKVVEPESAGSTIRELLKAQGKNNVQDLTARHIAQLLDGSHPFDAELAKHATGIGGDTPVLLQDRVRLGGKDVPAKYSSTFEGRKIAFANNITKEDAVPLIRHELVHNYYNNAVETNADFRNGVIDILKQVASHPELDNHLANHAVKDLDGGMLLNDPTEAVNKIKSYFLSTDTNAQEHPESGKYGYVKEFIAGLSEDNGIRDFMENNAYIDPNAPKKGTIKSLWDKFISLASSLFKRGKGTTKQQHESMMDALIRQMAEVQVQQVPDAFDKLSPDQSGAMKKVGNIIGGVELTRDDMTDENVRDLQTIMDYIATRQYPIEHLNESVATAKDNIDVIHDIFEKTGITTELANGAKAQADAQNLTYDDLTAKDKIRLTAMELKARQERNPEDVVADVDRIFSPEITKLDAVAKDDHSAIYSQYKGDTAAEMIQSMFALPNIKAATNYLNELTSHRDPHLYREQMNVLGEKLFKTSPEKKASWDASVRDIWRNRQNSKEIGNYRLVLGESEDGTSLASVEPITSAYTSTGKVNYYRNAMSGFDRSNIQLAKEGTEQGYAQSPTMQKAIDVITAAQPMQIHETEDRTTLSPPENGYTLRNMDDAARAELQLLKNDGLYMVKISNKGGLLFNLKPLTDYIFEENGRYAKKRLTEMNDGNLWKVLNSHELYNDGFMGERYKDISRTFSAVKIHEMMNRKSKTIDDISFDDIVRRSVIENGFVVNSKSEQVPIEQARLDFIDNKEALKGEFSMIANKLNTIHTGIHGEKIVPYAYRDEPGTIEEELLTQLNAMYHWKVDMAGTQYFADPSKSLPKIHEKYWGLSTGGSYVSYRTMDDALISMGYDKWASKSEDDWKNLHGIQTENGIKTMKFGILNADIIEVPELKKLLGKENTDGALFVFHREHMNALNALASNDGAGHVKTALVTHEDGYHNMNKGDTHFLDVDHYRDLVEENPQLAQQYQWLFNMADGIKAQGLFGVAMQTTMKGKGTYALKLDGDVAKNNKGEAIGVKKLDGTIDTDKEAAKLLNIDAATRILNGGAIPNFSVLNMDLHGDNAVSFVNSSGRSNKTTSPGISVNRMVRAVPGGKWWDAISNHVKVFEDNSINAVNNLANGYVALGKMAKGTGDYTSEELLHAGTFLTKLARHITNKEASDYSGVSSAREISRQIELSVTKDGLVRPEMVPGLLIHKELFGSRDVEGNKNPLIYAKELIAQEGDDRYSGRDVGTSGVVMPDLTAKLDHLNLIRDIHRKQTKEYRIDLLGRLGKDDTLHSNEDVYAEADATLQELHDAAKITAEKQYADNFDEQTGQYKPGSQGVTLSRDILSKLNKRAIADGMPEITLGTKVFLKITPSDDVSSFAPFIVMGMTETPNTIIANREFMLQVSGKDFDGDLAGIITNSPMWTDANGKNHYNEMHDKLTELKMHRGVEKVIDNQTEIVDGASKFEGLTALSLGKVRTADNAVIRPAAVPLNPMHPDHARYLLNTSRDISPVITEIHRISEALQNTIDRFKPDGKGAMVYTPKKGQAGIGLVLAYTPKLLGNYSLLKQLGAVDMYVAHGFNTEDLMYGTLIKRAVENGEWTDWSKLSEGGRIDAIKSFKQWANVASGEVITDVLIRGGDGMTKGQFPKDKVAAHFAEVSDSKSISSRMLRGLRPKLATEFDHNNLHGMVLNGLADVRAENPDIQKFVSGTLDKIAFPMRYVFNKPTDEKHKEGNYFSKMEQNNYAFRVQGDNPLEQYPETRIAMNTNYYNAIQSGSVNQTRPTKIVNGVTLMTDKSNVIFKVAKGLDTEDFLLKDVILKNGTIAKDFVSALERVQSDPSILYHPLVKNALKVPPLSLSEANFLIGATIANVGKYYEDRSNGSANADTFAGYALAAELPKIITQDNGAIGTVAAYQAGSKLESDPLGVIAGAKLNGVLPTVGVRGEKLAERIQYAVGSQSRYLINEGSSGAVTIRQPALTAIGKYLKDTFPDKSWDVRNPEHVAKMAEDLPAIMEKQYGELITPDRMPEIMAALHSTLHQDYTEANGRDMEAKDANARFVVAMSELDRSLRNHIPTIQAAGGLKGFMQTMKNWLHFDEITPFEFNNQTNIAHRFTEDPVIATHDYPVAPAFSLSTDGTIESRTRTLSHFINPELLTMRQVLQGARGMLDYGEYHKSVRQSIDDTILSFRNDYRVHKRLMTIGENYEAPDYNLIMKAFEAQEVPNINLRVTTRGGSGDFDATAYAVINGKEHSFVLSDEKIRANAEDAMKGLQLGFELGTTYTTARFSKNYDETTPLEKRRVFLSEVSPSRTLRNSYTDSDEYLQGEAYGKARDNAIETGEKLYHHDIATKQWYEEDPANNTMVPIDALPEGVVNTDNLHITSKLENHATLSQQEHHDYLDSLLGTLGVEPTSKRVTETVHQSLDQNVSLGNEHSIKRALTGLILGKMSSEKAFAMQREFMMGIDWLMERDAAKVPDYLTDYVEKVRADIASDIGSPSPLAGGTDFSDVIRHMSRVKTGSTPTVLNNLKLFMERAQDDNQLWENITRDLYHHEDLEAPLSRWELTKQVLNVKSTFNREIGSLERSLGKNGDRDYYKTDAPALNRDNRQFSVIDLMKALGLDDHIDISTENMYKKFEAMGNNLRKTLDYVTQTLYLKNPDPNDIAHRNILGSLSTSAKRGELRTVSEDIGQWKQYIKEHAEDQDYVHNIDPGTIFDAQILDNKRQPLILRDQSYLATVMRTIKDVDTGEEKKVPFILSLDKSRTITTWTALDNIQQMNSATHNGRNYDTSVLSKEMARSAELDKAIKAAIAAHPILQKVSDEGDVSITPKALPQASFHARNDVIDAVDLADRDSQRLFSRYRDFGEAMQVANTYLHQNAAVGLALATVYGAAQTIMHPKKIGLDYAKAVLVGMGKLAISSMAPIIQNYVALGSITSRTTEKSFLALKDNPVHSMLNSKTGILSVTRNMSDRDVDPSQANAAALTLQSRLEGHTYGKYDAEIASKGLLVDRDNDKGFVKNLSIVRMFTDPARLRKLEQIQKDVQESYGRGEMLSEGIHQLHQDVVQGYLNDLGEVNGEIVFVDGKAKVLIDGKTIDEERSKAVGFLAAMTAVTGGVFLQKSELHSAQVTMRINQNNIHKFVPQYDYLPQDQQNEITRGMFNFTNGNYNRCEYQKGNWGRSATIFQPYSAGKAIYQQQGGILRNNIMSTLSEAGSPNKGISVDGMIMRNPRAQLRAWLINGAATKVIGAGAAVAVHSFLPGTIINDLVQSNPASALLYGIFDIAHDAMYKKTMGDEALINAEGNIKSNLDQIISSFAPGMGLRSVTGVGTYGVQLGKDLVDGGNNRNLEIESEIKQGASVLKALMNSNPYTAPLSSVVSGIQEIKKMTKKH